MIIRNDEHLPLSEKTRVVVKRNLFKIFIFNFSLVLFIDFYAMMKFFITNNKIKNDLTVLYGAINKEFFMVPFDARLGSLTRLNNTIYKVVPFSEDAVNFYKSKGCILNRTQTYLFIRCGGIK